MNPAQLNTKNRFDSLDGLRAFSAIGIVLMHIRANTHFSIEGFAYNELIPSFTQLVFLFMIISSFSMFCGYYKRFINNEVNIIQFYKRRYLRILPYFAVLVLFDVAISHSLNSAAEGIMDISLLLGLLPNNDLTVIGVGWFLGVVFLFYIMFPFFCFLFSKKSSAWFTLIFTVLIHYCCTLFLFKGSNIGSGFVARNNFLYCMMYFSAGGLIYLYKDSLINFVNKLRYLFLAIIFAAIVPYFLFKKEIEALNLSPIYYLAFFSLVVIYAISTKGFILNNPITRFLSNISMEIYLTHMVAFRFFERLNIINLFGNNWYSYIFITVLVISTTILAALTIKKLISICEKLILKKKAAKNT